MRILIYYLLSINIFFYSCEGDTGVPVFLIDFDKVMNHMKVESNPLAKLSEDFFIDIVQEAVKNSKVVINFIEESLCAEDISAKDIKGTAFYHLRQRLSQEQVKYFPTVQNPYRILRKMFELHNLNVFYVSGAQEYLKMYESHFGHYYIYFTSRLNESRVESLRKHDMLMQEIYQSMRKMTLGTVLAFYTGRYNPIVVKDIDSPPMKRNIIPIDRGVTVESNDALFRFIGVYSSSPSRQARFNQIPVVAEERLFRRHLTTKVAYTDFELEFNFFFEKDGWTIDNVGLLEGGEEVGRSHMGVGAPWEFSYVCSEPLVIINMRDGSAVTISHYQIQPFRRAGRTFDDWPEDAMDEDYPLGDRPSSPSPSGSHGFGASVHCGPYFNIAILGALFVVAICLTMLLIAISFVYDCYSNNQYDDPQAKQLVIATEAGG